MWFGVWCVVCGVWCVVCGVCVCVCMCVCGWVGVRASDTYSRLSITNTAVASPHDRPQTRHWRMSENFQTRPECPRAGRKDSDIREKQTDFASCSDADSAFCVTSGQRPHPQTSPLLHRIPHPNPNPSHSIPSQPAPSLPNISNPIPTWTIVS